MENAKTQTACGERGKADFKLCFYLIGAPPTHRDDQCANLLYAEPSSSVISTLEAVGAGKNGAVCWEEEQKVTNQLRGERESLRPPYQYECATPR